MKTDTLMVKMSKKHLVDKKSTNGTNVKISQHWDSNISLSKRVRKGKPRQINGEDRTGAFYTPPTTSFQFRHDLTCDDLTGWRIDGVSRRIVEF